VSAGNQVSTRSQWLESLLTTHANAPLASQGELRQAGLPHGRVEDWRFTDLAPLLALNPAALRPRGGAQAAVASWPAVEQGVVRLMLAADGLTLVAAPGSAPWPAGVELQTEALAPYPLNSEATDLAPRLQAVLPGPQLGINLAAGAKLRLEVLLEPDGADALLAPRLAMELAEGAQLELWLRIWCRESALCLPLVTAHLARNARFQEGQGLEGCSAAVLLASSHVQQAPDSYYERTALVQGWGLARQDPQVLQSAGQAHTQLRDLALATGQAISDLHSWVRFEGPDGRLDQLQKALVDDQAHSVFNGSVQVPRLAQGTDAAQLSRHLLLSSRARVDTKPELEIVADDVRCSHGATVSSLADDELFYLQSRGIDRDRASSLLMRGFCAQIVASLPPLAAAWQPLERLLANAHG